MRFFLFFAAVEASWLFGRARRPTEGLKEIINEQNPFSHLISLVKAGLLSHFTKSLYSGERLSLKNPQFIDLLEAILKQPNGRTRSGFLTPLLVCNCGPEISQILAEVLDSVDLELAMLVRRHCEVSEEQALMLRDILGDRLNTQPLLKYLLSQWRDPFIM